MTPSLQLKIFGLEISKPSVQTWVAKPDYSKKEKLPPFPVPPLIPDKNVALGDFYIIGGIYINKVSFYS
jgi:hypothetical protein